MNGSNSGKLRSITRLKYGTASSHVAGSKILIIL
jgi:hypothetical protein